MKPGNKTKKDNFTEIFDQYYQTVFNVVYPKVGNVNDTEDICQEVFIALYRNLDEIQYIKKWIFGTLRNIVYNYYRDKKPDKIDIEDVFQDISLTFVNGFRDARIVISAAIDEEIKNEEERQIIDLIAFNNYSYAHVAKLMGQTKRMIQYRYTQLVKRILGNLKNRGIKNIEDLL
jgi:RNA polymerase sigma-70 factor, ECF subfamily